MARATRNATAARKLELALRRREVIRLRLKGRSFVEIGSELGIGTTTAFRDVTAAIQEAAEKRIADGALVLDLELARLDAIQAGAWDKALAGDPECVRACLAVITQRAKLLGIEAPTRVDILTRDQASSITRAMGTVVDTVLRELVTDPALREALAGAIVAGWEAIKE